MKISLKLLSKEEALLGVRFATFNFLDGEDENKRPVINEYFGVSIGIFFCALSIEVPRGRVL